MSELNLVGIDIEIINKRKKLYRCHTCHFVSLNKTKASEHVLSKKHRLQFDDNFKQELERLKAEKILIEKLPEIVSCDVCNKRMHKTQYNNHVKSQYHYKRTNNIMTEYPKRCCTYCNNKEFTGFYWEVHIRTHKHIKNVDKFNKAKEEELNPIIPEPEQTHIDNNITIEN